MSLRRYSNDKYNNILNIAMITKKIRKETIKSIYDGHVAIAKDDSGRIVALRTKDGVTRCIGYVHDLPLFCSEAKAGVGNAWSDKQFKIGLDVEFVENDSADIVSRLRDERVSRGITQSEVAERMGTVQQSIARMESGMHSPSVEMVTRYADAIGCHLTIEDNKTSQD